jgi:amidohydrolase
MRYSLSFILLFISAIGISQADTNISIEKYAKEIEPTIIELRRAFHQSPELSNREFKTAKQIAGILTQMGLKVDTGIAKTGVIAVLDSGKPGPTVGLRADIDGLPVTERTDLAFASKVKTEFLGEDVGVMHACGHDTHISMLIGAASVLIKMKSELKGKVVFIFQPAEEGAPPGEEGGAALMVKEGIIEKYGIDVMFGQHINAATDIGKIKYRVGGIMAAVNRMVIKVKGKQTHGSRPWSGVDPITISAQIIMGLQTVVSRQTDLTKNAAVISIGKIKGGLRSNIIPEEVEMIGTIRTLDTNMQKKIHEDIRRTVTLIAEAGGAVAEVTIEDGYPVTLNDPTLTRKMIGSLYDAAGEDNVMVTVASTGAEDFAFFAQKVPALYYFVGGKPLDTAVEDVAPHHTPDFYIDEAGMITGIKALAHLTIDYMNGN